MCLSSQVHGLLLTRFVFRSVKGDNVLGNKAVLSDLATSLCNVSSLNHLLNVFLSNPSNLT